MSDYCVSSPNYPAKCCSDGSCDIFPLETLAYGFATETNFDYLTIDSVRYEGTSGPMACTSVRGQLSGIQVRHRERERDYIDA